MIRNTAHCLILLAAVIFNLSSLPALAQSSPEQSLIGTEHRAQLQTLIDSPSRSEEARARNRYRNPLPTLDFFNVIPQQTVVEIWPGGQGGWYRSILEPYIGSSGVYIPVRDGSNFPLPIAEVADNSADRVLVFRAHGFMIYEHPAQDYYNSIFLMLKPGGIFGIVDHRGNEEVPQDPSGESGYVNQSHVVAMALAAGFELLATAEINANAADHKDHPDGVYSLPPTLRGSFINRSRRAQMLNIGESDRMTLKFVKPQ